MTEPTAAQRAKAAHRDVVALVTASIRRDTTGLALVANQIVEEERSWDVLVKMAEQYSATMQVLAALTGNSIDQVIEGLSATVEGFDEGGTEGSDPS